MADWYRDWQQPAHAVQFDGRVGLDRRNLIRNYEGFNDVRLLCERVDVSHRRSFLEVGCATGEFFRYLRMTYPLIRYYGVDISQPAIARTTEKYPQAFFFTIDPSRTLAENLRAGGSLPDHYDIVYAKDVVQHQLKPFEFMHELIQVASEAVILRCRTRDVGASVLDPELSCQAHYGGWVPYMVLNLQELLDWIARETPDSEIVVYRNHTILGGRYNRFVPKDLYVTEAGTAETAVGIFKQTTHPGRVILEDRADQNPIYTWDYTAKHMMSEIWRAFRACRPLNGRRRQ